ncbi:cytochrome c3 family protein [Shewanella maritima]|uniref:cytochrome c3 family protein n=1 Tax=Shewanella maritima TaxID=2520507 RepID=UPI0037367924
MNHKSILFSLLVILCFALPAVASTQNLADYHTEMDGCESCHFEGDPSADGAYEFAQCQVCHGTLADRDRNHRPHANMLLCTDCHAPHDANIGDRIACSECHADTRKAR